MGWRLITVSPCHPSRVRVLRRRSSSSSCPSSCQVPGSTTSPIPSIRLRNISSSSGSKTSPIPLIRLTCPVPVKVKVQFQFQFQDPSPFQIQPYESDSIDPTQFYSSVYGSSFQPGPRLIASVGGPIPESRNPSVWCPRQTVPLRSSGRLFTRPSPTTYPENCTNPCAELVEAESLVICEEITWRPFFVGRWWTA